MARRWQGPLAAALVVCTVPAFAQQLPEGPGKEIVEKQCSTCHTIEVIVAQRNDASAWKQLVMNMIDRGAEITDEQVPVVIEYLAANWNKPSPPPAVEKPAEQSAPIAPVAAH